MPTDPPETPSGWTALFGVILLMMGVVETFVTPDPGSYFGEALLVFGPAMLLLWWSGRTGSRALSWIGQGLAVVGTALALFDIVTDLLG